MQNDAELDTAISALTEERDAAIAERDESIKERDALRYRLTAAEAWRKSTEEACDEAHEAMDAAYDIAAAAEAARDEACARAERVEKLIKLLADAQPTVARHGDEITLYCPDTTIADDLYDALEAASYGPALASPAPVEES